jgi:anti-sigma regulatory factor (Ser/Thr protein kinase)
MIHAQYTVVRGDYARAGEASAAIKRTLKQLGVDSSTLRRIAVASYECELNLVIHSLGGTLTLDVDDNNVKLVSQDQGPGISDVNEAMREGYSTADDAARSYGFGAGMGLPNMRRNADQFEIYSMVPDGTTIEMQFTIG